MIDSVKIEQWETEEEIRIHLLNHSFGRPNHPHNCLTLDLYKYKKYLNLKTVKFYFKNGTHVIISIEDRLKSVHRANRLNKFCSSGPRFYLNEPSKAVIKYYAVQLRQTVYVEADKSKSCVDYPNTQYESYSACDDAFVQKFLKKTFPEDFLPIWATDNITNVTNFLKLKAELSEKQKRRYSNLIKGKAETDCFRPCKSTQIKAVFNDEKTVAGSRSKIELIFSNKVSIFDNRF